MGNNSFSDALHNDPAGFIRRLIRGISRGDHLRENREFFQFLLHNRLRLLSGFNAELEHVLPYSLDEKYLIETGWMIIQLMVEVLIFNELTETLKRAHSRAFLRPLIGWISIYIMLSVCTDSEISSKSYTSTTDVQNFIKCLNGEKLLAYINSRAILTEITAQRFAPLYHQVVLEITGHCKRFLETIIQGGLTKIGKKIASCIPICEQSAHPHSYSNAADFDLPDSIPLSSNSNSVIALNSIDIRLGIKTR